MVLHSIRLEKETKLRDWFKQLHARADEVQTAFERETVGAGKVYILQEREGSILVYVIEAEDVERARQAY